MALRAKKPEAVDKRLKLFMFGPAGVGKTTAAIQFPNSYIIDCEKGTENYDKIISASGSAVFQTNDMGEVIQEVKSLLTEQHDFRTLVIDPVTPAYNDLLEKCEAKVGADFGRHYGVANKEMKRLANLIMALDMNVVITAHAKKEYGDNLRVLGQTFDGWRQLDYWFDLVVELGKKGKKRFAKVVKTRVESFPDEDVFEWSYDAIKQRYDVITLEQPAVPIALATPEQVNELKGLLEVVRLPDGTTEKWLNKAGVDDWEDMPREAMGKSIAWVRARLPGGQSAAPSSNGASSRHTVAEADAESNRQPEPPAEKPDLKETWRVFVEQCEAAAQKAGLSPESLKRGMDKVAVAHRIKGREWEMSEAAKADMLKAIMRGEGHFVVVKETAGTAA